MSTATTSAASPVRDDLARWGPTVLRVTTGVIFLAHGYQKLFVWGLGGVTDAFAQMGLPLPAASAALATFAEFFGGIALILGLGTRLAALPLAVTMVVAALTAHRTAFFLPAGFEFTLALFGASVALLLTGPGALAADNVVARLVDRRREIRPSRLAPLPPPASVGA